MRRLPTYVGLVALVVSLSIPSVVKAQQSLSFQLGAFSPTGEDSRSTEDGFSNDVLVNNLDFLAFNIKDFSGATFNAEYLVGLGEFIDAGLGVGAYKRSVPSVDANFVNVNGAEIEQTLRLRIIPFTASIRWLPIGRSKGIEPYIGAGLGVFNWRYSESGEWVDTFDDSIFRESYVGSGTATGPVVLGGLRLPLGSWGIGGEVRYQRAEGELPIEQGFSADKIDLGGWTYGVTFQVRF